jgi:hypothetical protein
LFISTCGGNRESGSVVKILHTITHRGFEDKKYMRVIMRVKDLASVAEILWTISTSEPFAMDSSHATVAHSSRMYQGLEIIYR